MVLHDKETVLELHLVPHRSYVLASVYCAYKAHMYLQGIYSALYIIYCIYLLGEIFLVCTVVKVRASEMKTAFEIHILLPRLFNILYSSLITVVIVSLRFTDS